MVKVVVGALLPSSSSFAHGWRPVVVVVVEVRWSGPNLSDCIACRAFGSFYQFDSHEEEEIEPGNCKGS
jgi:hypothetical protein